VSSLRHAKSCAVDLYNLARTVTKRLGRFDLSLLAADRAVRATEAADDALRLFYIGWTDAGQGTSAADATWWGARHMNLIPEPGEEPSGGHGCPHA
jgi:hypothetical protein